MKRIGLLLIALALVMVACSDDASTATNDSGSTATAGSPSTTAPESVTTSTAPIATTTTAAARPACDHTYMPVRAGSKWVFETGSGELITWEVMSVSPDGTEAVMAAEIVSGETGEEILPIEVNLTCGSFGMQAPELAFGGLPMGTTVTQVVEEGVFLPPADQMVPGATWSSVVNVTAELQDAPGVTFEIRREAIFTVEGEEEITTSLGTFTALKVRSDFAMEMDMGGVAFPSAMGVEFLWFVEGIGLVRETGENADTTLDNELIEVTIPD